MKIIKFVCFFIFMTILTICTGCGEEGLLGVIDKAPISTEAKNISIHNSHSTLNIDLPFDLSNEKKPNLSGDIAPYIDNSFNKFGSNQYVAARILGYSFDVDSINKDFGINFNINLDNMINAAKSNVIKLKNAENVKFDKPKDVIINDKKMTHITGTYTYNDKKNSFECYVDLIIFIDGADSWEITIIGKHDDNISKNCAKDMLNSIKFN